MFIFVWARLGRGKLGCDEVIYRCNFPSLACLCCNISLSLCSPRWASAQRLVGSQISVHLNMAYLRSASFYCSSNYMPRADMQTKVEKEISFLMKRKFHGSGRCFAESKAVRRYPLEFFG
jgi:hypothetical protein